MFVQALYCSVSQDMTPSPLSNKAREMRKVIGTCAMLEQRNDKSVSLLPGILFRHLNGNIIYLQVEYHLE